MKTHMRWVICSCLAVGLWVLAVPGCGPQVPKGKEGSSSSDGGTPTDASGGDAGRKAPPEGRKPAADADPTPASVETTLSKNNAMAGEKVDVTCTAKNKAGIEVSAETEFRIDPKPKGTINPGDVTIEEAGTFKVSCQLKDGSLVDETPEELVIAGASATLVETEVSPNPAKAGETVKVTCSGTDRFGNPTSTGFSVQVSPNEKITLNGTDFVGTKAGKYQVACVHGGFADPSPAILDITPGLADSIELTPDPGKPYYKAEETILLNRKIQDKYGNPIQTYDVKVTVSPDAKDIDKTGYPDSIAFKSDGEYTVTVSVDPPTEGGKKVEASLTLKVDGQGPQITISYPPRAAMLDGDSKITIKGKVTDPGSPVVELKINGQTVRPDGNGEFSVPMTSTWGVNLIVAEATDKAGNAGYRAQSYMWSTRYHPHGSKKIAKAAMVRLNQKAIDDGDRSTLNDLASILERVVNTIDIDSEVPSTITSGSKKYKIPPFGPTISISYSVKKNGKVTIGKRSVSLTARSGGLDFSATFRDVRVPLRAAASPQKYLNKSLTIVGSSVPIRGSADIRYANGKLDVVVTSMSADVSKIEVKAFGGIFGFLNGLLTSLLRSTIKKELEKALRKALPDPIGKFIQGLQFDTLYTLPASLGNKSLKLDSQLDYLIFDSKGATLGLAASTTTTKGIADGKKGTPLGPQSAPTFSSTDAFGVGLSYNVLNQVFSTAWLAGALKQDVSKLFATAGGTLPLTPSNLKVQIDAQLPIILEPGTQGHDVHLVAGDLLLDTEFDMQGTGRIKAKAYLTVRFGAKLGLNPSNEITIQLDTKPLTFAVDVIQLEGLGAANLGDFGKLLQTLAPQLSQLLSTAILQKMPIPSIDLSSFGGKYGIPTGTQLTLKKGKIFPKGDYLKLSGDL